MEPAVIDVIEPEPLALAGIAAALDGAEDLALGEAWASPADAGPALESGSRTLLVDFGCLGEAALPAVHDLAQRGHRVVARATGIDVELVHVLLEAGVHGVLSRRATADEVLAGIRQVVNDQPCVPAAVRPELHRRFAEQRPSVLTALTERESEVLVHIVEGTSAHEIGERMKISVPTVRTYLRNAYGKLGVDGQGEAALRLRHLGLLDRESLRRAGRIQRPARDLRAAIRGS